MTIGSLVRWYDMAAARSNKESGESPSDAYSPKHWTTEDVENAREQLRKYQAELAEIEREITERKASGEYEFSNEMQTLNDRASGCRGVIATTEADLTQVEAHNAAHRAA